MNIWKDLATEINGKFVEGIAWRSDRTEVNYKNFILVFDNFTLWSGKYSQEFTRVRFAYNSDQNFVFKIYRNGIVGTVEKIFGAQDVKIGFDEFDKAFIIKSNDDYKIFELLKSESLRNLIEALDVVNLEVSSNVGIREEKLPENEYELCYYSDTTINDIEKLKGIYELFQAMINRLLDIKAIKAKAEPLTAHKRNLGISEG